MNRQVADNIKTVIKEWISGTRNYTFETRGIKYANVIPGTGEYVIVFELKVNGFYTDKTRKKEVDLTYTSPSFISQTLTAADVEDENSDAYNLKQILEEFTKECYYKIEDEMKKYPEAYTTDFLYWK